MAGRVIGIGDIHGCLDKLEGLIDAINPDPADKLIFLGDYIDRGPDSKGVIQYLLDLQHRVPCIFLRGNHEDMLLRALDGDDAAAGDWIANGGWQAMESYGTNLLPQDWPSEHLDFLRSTRLVHREPGFIFVHAGLRPGVGLLHQNPEDMMWIRDTYLKSDFDWGAVVVTGHTPTSEPKRFGNKILIDTGAVFEGKPGYGKLTGWDVLSDTVYQVGVLVELESPAMR